jgi:hypothetical protein
MKRTPFYIICKTMPNKAISYLCLNPMNLTLRIKLSKIDSSEGAIQTGHFNKVAEDDRW